MYIIVIKQNTMRYYNSFAKYSWIFVVT